MRTVLTTLALTLSLSLSATHLITGHLSFNHVSTGTNTSIYEVSLVLYSDVTGVAMPTSITVYYEKLGQLLRSGTLTERIDLRGVASGTLLLTLKNIHSIKQYKLVKR
ncbi:MAG: hypothetical protein O2862_09025 [Bacteroidetes bacterium]|nr:hypothetical protein [Bacteroidota bacterium]MDA0899369.1 hypothetical protein [Bacteroidota bacterium]